MDRRRGGLQELQGTVLGRVWPGERTVLGLRVCRWLRSELKEYAERVVLKLRQEQTGETSNHETEANRSGSLGADIRRDLSLFEQNLNIAIEVHRLSSCTCLDSVLAAMTAPSHRVRAIRLLDLNHCSITHAVAESAATLFSQQTDLKQLTMRGVSIREPLEHTLSMLTQGLRHCEALTHIDVSKNNLGCKQAFHDLITSLTHHTTLAHIHLGENNMSSTASQPTLASIACHLSCRVLALNGNQIGADGAVTLAGALRNCTALEYLDIGGNGIGMVGATALADSISGATGLRVLKLAGNGMANAGATAVGAAVGACVRLRELDLTRNDVGAAGVEALMRGLAGGGGVVESLQLRENGMTEDAAVLLCALLASSPALQHLDLSANPLAHKSGAGPNLDHPSLALELPERDPAPLAAARETLRRLLEVEWCASPAKGGGPGGSTVQVPVEFTSVQLESLELASCGLGPEGVGQLGAVLSRCRGLRRLSLRGNRVGGGGAEAVAAALRVCRGLRSVDLTGCKLGAEGVECVAVALGVCKELESLWLGGNEAMDRGVEGVSAVLGGWGRLQTLHLRGSGVGVRGAVALGRGLAGCTALTVLDLAHNELGRAGGRELALGLGGCSGLQQIVLRNNELGEEGAVSVAEGVRGRCLGLRLLDLRSNGVGKAGARAVVATLRDETALTCLDLRCNNKSWF